MNEQELLNRLRELSCCDNSCYLFPSSIRGGMGTNGGCSCFEKRSFHNDPNLKKAVQVIKIYQQLLKLYRNK